jgi:hypothetical protein
LALSSAIRPVATVSSRQTQPKRYCSPHPEQASFTTGVVLPVGGGVKAARRRLPEHESRHLMDG